MLKTEVNYLCFCYSQIMNKKAKIIIFAILTVAVAGLGSLLILKNQTKSENLSEPTNGELNIQLGLDKSKYSIGEMITFKSSIENTNSSGKSYTFNSTCTQGMIYIDGQPTQ